MIIICLVHEIHDYFYFGYVAVNMISNFTFISLVVIYGRVNILPICGNHQQYYTILLTGKVWGDKTNLTPSLFIKVCATSQESEQ